jgi:hypothetical protein
VAHMDVLAGTDFFTVEVLTWRGLVTYYVLFFLHLETRRVTLAGVTRHPTEEWMRQIARNGIDEQSGCLRQHRYVLHDRDDWRWRCSAKPCHIVEGGSWKPCLGSTVLRFQADAIVDCVSEPLLAANVSLGGLDALVAKEELDLLDLAAGVMTQASASAPQIMGSDTGQITLTARRRHHWPDHFWTEPVWGNPTGLVDCTKDRSGGHGGSTQPRLNGGPNPIRNWNSSDVAALSDQIRKHPVLLSPLKVPDSDGCEFGTAEPAAQ